MKQPLSEQFRRMQTLAGIITENKNFIKEGQYLHNGMDVNQIINYDDDIADDLEALGQGSMDGQDFEPGKTYNIGGQDYEVQAQGDEFKLVLAESQINEYEEEGSGYSYEYEEGKGADPKEITDIINRYLEDKFTWNRMVRNDFESMADGESADIKSEYYPDWKKSDFQKVIDALDESEN